MKWRVETLDARVDAELELLEPSLKARFLHICELLETFGPHEVGLPARTIPSRETLGDSYEGEKRHSAGNLRHCC